MSEKEKKRTAPPEISPYLFPVILAVMGVWCFYDGFLTTDLEMLEHQTFNRVCSGVLLPWAIIDFIRTRKADLKEKDQAAHESKDEDGQDDS